MKKGAFLALALALAALLAFAGCGGDDETSSLTKAEFTKQANAGCKEHEEERGELFEEVTRPLDPNEYTKADQELIILEALLPPYERNIENLKSLGAPSGDEQQVEAIIEAMEKSVEKVEDEPIVAIDSTRQFEESNALAEKYGLDACVI